MLSGVTSGTAREQKLGVSCCQSLIVPQEIKKRNENAYEVENESRIIIIDKVDDNTLSRQWYSTILFYSRERRNKKKKHAKLKK